MGSQAHTETQLTRRQISARKQAERTKAINQVAKAWLAGRKKSATPVADRLIARHIGKGWNEEGARESLYSCLKEWGGSFGRYVQTYIFTESVAYKLMRSGFISQRNNLTNVVAFMQEAGVPEKYWRDEAAQLAAQAAAKPRRRKPVQWPLIETDEPAPVSLEKTVAAPETRIHALLAHSTPVINTQSHTPNEEQVSTLKNNKNKVLEAEMPQKVATYQKRDRTETEPKTAIDGPAPNVPVAVARFKPQTTYDQRPMLPPSLQTAWKRAYEAHNRAFVAFCTVRRAATRRAWIQISPFKDLAAFHALKAADPALHTALQQVETTANTLRAIDTQAQTVLIKAIETPATPPIKEVKAETAARSKRDRHTPKPSGLALAA